MAILLTILYEKITEACIFPKNIEEIHFSDTLNLKGLLQDELFSECCCENSEDVTERAFP